MQAQAQNLKLFTEARASDDRAMFSRAFDRLSTPSNMDEIDPDDDEWALAEAIDWTWLFLSEKYLQLPDVDVAEWESFYDALNFKSKYSDQADIKLLHAMADNLDGVLTADVQLPEVSPTSSRLVRAREVQQTLYKILDIEIIEQGYAEGSQVSF
ncbi:hypothetical protein B0I35DRAFT_414615 [Stachybotrys elegans]|uniref:Uncharacterized protein n=1 Tax=Stachybotrys elegans TaxID=80388 RepID=A0A8K0SFA1_9HYPO|nr:hypothetical protein B0I35DRAFT_414615 [Stachybotrys elegans]